MYGAPRQHTPLTLLVPQHRGFLVIGKACLSGDEALRMRAEGASWRKIAQTLELAMSTVIDSCRSENPPVA